MIKTHHTFEQFESPCLLPHQTLLLSSERQNQLHPTGKQGEAKRVFYTAIYSIIVQLPGQTYSKLLLFTALLVFVDETE